MARGEFQKKPIQQFSEAGDNSERLLLSCLMRVPEFIRSLEVESAHFTRETHRILFSLLAEMVEEGIPVNESSIPVAIEARRLSSLLGSPDQIDDLYWLVTSPSTAPDYFRTVDDLKRKRDLLLLSDQIRKDLSDGALSLEEIQQKVLISLENEGKGSEEGDIVTVSSLSSELMELYRGGLPPGFSTGWETLDRFWTVQPGEMTVLTGIPNHGKSTWCDNLLVNLMEDHGLKVGIYSPENYPYSHHLARLAEVRSRKTFIPNHFLRITEDELREAQSFLSKHMSFINPSRPTLSRILSCAEQIKNHGGGLDLLVLDPWNEIEHEFGENTETQYISDALGKIRRWARKNKVHILIVAHPMKLSRDRKTGEYPVPTPYDINGSANWRNKPDNCLCVWRDLSNPSGTTDIHVQKVRMKNVGMVGMVELAFDRLTNRYYMP